jgi:hypothetical protein
MAHAFVRPSLAIAAAIAFQFPGPALSHGASVETPPPEVALQAVPAALAVRGPLSQPSEGVMDLRFRDMIKMPIGPRGLEPTEKLIGLNGKRVRMVGFMARQEAATPGLLILTPMPVALGDRDESLSDDLPGNAVFVHLRESADTVPPYLPGLIQLTGVLEIGAKDEADGHVSSYRLRLDAEPTREISVLSRSLVTTAKTAQMPR